MGAGQESKNIRYVQAGVSNITLEDDVINCDSSQGVITLLLPNINGSGILYNTKTFSINDFSGTAATNNIEVVGIGGNKINDASVLTISTNGESGKIFVLSQNDYLYEGNSSGGGGSTIVTTPFTPTNSTIIVGDDFQSVAEKAQGQINAIITDVTNLGNNERKIIYYAEINAASGTITKPIGSTIMLDQFYGGVDAYVSQISNGKPTGDLPLTAGDNLVDVTSFNTSGDFVLSGIPNTYPVALIYTIKISDADYANVDLNFVIEEPPINLEQLSISSGLVSGGEVTINGGDNTKIDIAPLAGVLTDYWTNPGEIITTEINYAGATGVTVTYLGTNTYSFIGIDKNGAIVQFANVPTNAERRENIILAQLGHANLTTVNSVNDYTSVYASPIEQYRDLVNELYLINDGNYVYANGANLNINKSLGYLFGMGVNFHNNPLDPNRITVNSQVVASFRYRTQTGGSTTPVTLIDPTVYDNVGTITAIGGSNNQSTNQRVYLFPNGNIVIQYGQTVYSTLGQAVSNIQSETFVKFGNLDAAILIGIISVTKGCTALNNTNNAKFILTTKFGENIGGSAGISTSTLQNAYDNSANPEIVTDSTRGAVTIKRGSGADTDDVFEVLNGSDVKNFSVTGIGEILSNSETASTIASFDANKKIKSLATSTYPSLTELSYVKGLTSALQTQLDGKLTTFVYQSSNTAPANNTTYFLGAILLALATVETQRQFMFDITRTLKTVVFSISQATNGGGGTVTIYLRNVTQATEVTIGTFANNFGLNTATTFVYTGLSSSVNTSDFYVWKIVTPAAGTTPTAWGINITALFV